MRHVLIAAVLAAASPALAAPEALVGFLANYDVNRDDTVTRAEFDADRMGRYLLANTNGDDWISEAEYVVEQEPRVDPPLEKSTNPDQGRARFAAVDADKDGKLTRAEYDAAGVRMFAEQDRNKDGQVNDADGQPAGR